MTRWLNFLIFISLIFYSKSESSSNITIKSSKDKWSTGREAMYECESKLSKNVTWLDDTSIEIRRLNSTRKYQSYNNLIIKDLNLNDSGVYICRDGYSRRNITVNVYERPSYVTAGIVILTINGALILTFFGCLLKSHFYNKKMNEKKKNYDI